MTPSLTTITVELVDGTQVVVPDSLDLITPYVLQEQGDWFEDEIKFLRRLVQPGQTVVDIGANYGVYALSLARRVGPKGQVWAFEPASATADLLAESIRANGTSWLHLERQALSDQCGSAWLRLPGQAELNSLAPTTDDEVPGDQEAKEKVALTTLDACLEEFGWQQVDLVKIDAEGEEERILAGGQRFFRQLSPLVMFEVKAGVDLHLELVERFRALGYECFRLVPGLDALMPFQPAAGVDGYLLNLFAAKPDRIAALAAEGWLVPTSEPNQPEAALLQPYYWSEALASLPYGSALAPLWHQEEHSEAAESAAEAMALWVFSNDRAQPIGQRLGALQESYRLLIQQAMLKGNVRLTLPRLSSLARVARDLGERSVSLRALEHLIQVMEAGIEPDLSQPFLPLSPRFDGIDPTDRLGEWLEAAALETDEVLGSYSSFYSGIKARPRLERLQALGFVDPAMQQRLALLNRRFPPRPLATPEMEANENEINGEKKPVPATSLPKGATACFDQANLLFEQGEYEAALSAYTRAAELAPEDPAPLIKIGITHKKLGQPEEGKSFLEQAMLQLCYKLAIEPADHLGYLNLAICCEQLGDLQQALEAIEKCLAINPDYLNGVQLQARCLRLQGKLEEAISPFQQVIRLDPELKFDSLTNIGIIRIHQGRAVDAIALFEEALALRPFNKDTVYCLALAYSISGPSYSKKMLQAAKEYWAYIRQQKQGEKHERATASIAAHNRERIRIGILSAELGNHVVSFFLNSFLEYYDREQFDVELIETHAYNDAYTQMLKQKCNYHYTLVDLDPDQARSLVIDRDYDVIIETSGFTEIRANSGLDILAERCAPVQCHYIGYHATTGLNTIDYFIGDGETAGEDLSEQFSETLWRLPRTWLACTPPSQPPLAAWSGNSSQPVFGSFSQMGKLGEETLLHWAEAMRAVPDALLLLKNKGISDEAARNRIVGILESRGIEPNRLLFLLFTGKWEDHMNCYNQVDIALDTTPWSSATTGFEALAMGVPLLTIRGGCMAARMGSSLVRGLNRKEWIAQSPETFAQLASALVQDLPRLRTSKGDLQREVLASRLFDGADLTHHLQQSFKEMLKEKGRDMPSPSPGF